MIDNLLFSILNRSLGRRIVKVIICLLGLWIAWDLLAHLIVEILWFIEVNYLSAFLLRIKTQFSLWAIVATISTVFLFSNLCLAHRLQYSQENLLTNSSLATFQLKDNPSLLSATQRKNPNQSNPNHPHSNSNTPQPVLTLRLLLPVVLLLSVLIGLMVLHYGKIAISLWHIDLTLPDITPPLPSPFNWFSVTQLLRQLWREEIWQLGVLAGIAIVVVINPQFSLSAIAIVLCVCWAMIVSSQWGVILKYFHPTSFHTRDPLFAKNISFYLFQFPLWQLFDFWLGGLLLFGFAATTLTYLSSGNSLSEGKFPGFSSHQLRHLYGLGSGLIAMISLRYWLSRYELLYSPRGVTYGASYTDVNAQLPINTALSIVAGAIAILLLLTTLASSRSLQRIYRGIGKLLGVYLTGAAIAGLIIPLAIQRLSVQPNELAREKPYIERSIALTRKAFALDSIETEIFNPEGQLTRADLDKNILTIRNVRLWDTRPILQTNRQLQRIRPYYEFPNADIDRYTLKTELNYSSDVFESQPTIIKKSDQTNNSSRRFSPRLINAKQQVIITPRELDYNAVPEQAKTWVNKHLIYTHGYGFTLSPVNTADDGGLPTYFVKDIGLANRPNQDGNLSVSSPLIRDSIPIGTPRIYYGELTNIYVMTQTKLREFDYPSGQDNVYNVYDGRGGIALSSVWQRLVFSQHLRDWQMLFTRNFNPETKLLFRRNINQRIRAIAPFLRYDNDPYLITAKTDKNSSETNNNSLYWIVDGYTTSDRYPYSDPGEHEFNYIRNSVKVVIDAYNGDVQFYIADPNDPMIKTWSKIFPDFFKPLEAMPATIKSHIRYPIDIFSVQAERLQIYHMTDPQVFYNREDLWRIPQEIYGGKPQQVEPYYLIMKLPTTSSEEFILLNPYTPASRNNLIAWLAGRSDGNNYGKLLVYQFPKQELVYGPEQIEALINQDPIISQQISLWNTQGSRAIQGNLLVIPIERSLLYVEPLYLEAEQNSLPTLVRVIVVYQNRIVMAKTLEEALQGIFKPESQSESTLIRPVQEPSLPLK